MKYLDKTFYDMVFNGRQRFLIDYKDQSLYDLYFCISKFPST